MSCIIRSFRNYGLKINGMCINSITIREKLFGDSIVVWCATFLLVKLFSSKCLHVKKRNERNDVRNTLKFETMFWNRHGHPTRQTLKRNGQGNAKAMTQTQKRNGQLNAKAMTQTQKRNGQLNAKAMKQTQKRNGQLNPSHHSSGRRFNRLKKRSGDVIHPLL